MTSMVVTLHLNELVGELFAKYGHSLCGERSLELLIALQGSYWHARSFNEDQELRSALGSRSFMTFPEAATLLPHLLEQEAASASKIAEVSMQLFLRPESQQNSDAEPWIRR